MSWAPRRLSDERGSLAGDSRAVSNLIGFILLFSVLLLALAVWQAQVVPQETAQSEFQHHQTVQDELIEFRNAVFETATDDGSSFSSATATSITLGTTHPSRILTVGPPSSAGTLQTSQAHNITVHNTRTNRTEEVPTRFVEYSPQYSEYNIGSIWYENSMLYLDDPDATEPIVLADQQVDTGQRVRVIPTQNEINENGIEATSIDMETASKDAVEQLPELFEADTRRMQIVMPTRLNGTEYWDSQLNGSVQYNTTDDFYDEDVHALELLVEPDLEINTVGFQSEPRENSLRSPNDDGPREFSDANDDNSSDLEEDFADLSSDEEESYVIMDDRDLQAINANESSRSANYTLGTNIDASETGDWYEGRGFDPIGNDTHPFNGTLDGNGYVIHGLTIDRPDQNGVGLFNSTDDATIQNIGIVEANVTGNEKVGGLVGNQSEGGIENSYTRGNIDGGNFVGGLVGQDGFVGTGGHIQNSHSAAAVTGTGNQIGGLVGRIGSNGAIENSYATGDVEGGDNEDIGGLVGQALGSDNITNSYATGDVKVGENVENVGGLVGENNDNLINNSFATGAVVGGDDDTTGGLVGEVEDAEVEDAYWDNGTTNQQDGIGNSTNSYIDIEGFGNTSDAEPAEEMIGEAAEDYMDFEWADDWLSPGDWRALEHPDDYPMLHRQAD